MNQKMIFIAILVFLFNFPILSHGENKPGPHGGLIRMPGNFHVEILDLGNSKYQIYLLDINFENPSLKSSSLVAKLRTSEGYKNLSCEAAKNSFICTGDPKSKKTKKELILFANRENSKGSEIKLELPLKKDNGDNHEHKY
ncbi:MULTISPECIES: hypothetical protein [unclassified Leptospira]|uniref:hypothetical protein n=1 Tax=unclassified Leptospira TaxID=2633828 RepID=UPI0002BF876C|nr:MULTISPECIES: hypothetical protein [unclassified Leptospira]EMK00368.1 hypothetical protein LEP1GSC192_2166 [Leptospira sp. B5-022]MCR1793738.1 hypothetical protein [Leptospira sp. id769339]